LEGFLDNSNENRRGILVAKALFVLTFLLPFLIVLREGEYASEWWLIYSPTWIAGVQDGQFLWGFTPTMLVMFQLWIFYPVLGYLSIKYSRGGYPTTKSFMVRIAFVALIAVLFTIPITIIYVMNYGSIHIPIPIAPIVTLLMIPWIKPLELKTPWHETPAIDPDIFEEENGAEGEI